MFLFINSKHIGISFWICILMYLSVFSVMILMFHTIIYFTIYTSFSECIIQNFFSFLIKVFKNWLASVQFHFNSFQQSWLELNKVDCTSVKVNTLSAIILIICMHAFGLLTSAISHTWLPCINTSWLHIKGYLLNPAAVSESLVNSFCTF